MSKKISRMGKGVELFLTIDDSFFEVPIGKFRDWIFERYANELFIELEYTNHLGYNFIKCSERKPIEEGCNVGKANYDENQLIIDEQQVMQDWERPYMKAMADVVSRSHGDVLEIGFGMGISASMIQENGVRSYTVLECNADVKDYFNVWKKKYENSKIELIFGRWEEIIESLGCFDGIFFDTYPLSEEEWRDRIVNSGIQRIFKVMSEHLNSGGVLTYFTGEYDSIARRDQRKIFEYFSEISIKRITELAPPEDCNYWFLDAMVLIQAIK